jgi:B-cell receptor-associated protein 31
MSLQWTIIASFLYTEIIVVLILVLPIASPQKWQRFFKSRFFKSIRDQAGIYFFVLLATLVLFFLDALREMKKYSNLDKNEHAHLDAEMQGILNICSKINY